MDEPLGECISKYKFNLVQIINKYNSNKFWNCIQDPNWLKWYAVFKQLSTRTSPLNITARFVNSWLNCSKFGFLTFRSFRKLNLTLCHVTTLLKRLLHILVVTAFHHHWISEKLIRSGQPYIDAVIRLIGQTFWVICRQICFFSTINSRFHIL